RVVHICFCCDVERTGYFVISALDILCCSFCPVNLQSFYAVIQRSKRDISDCVIITSYCSKHYRSAVCNLCFFCGHINLLAVYFFFNSEQLNESSSGSGSILTGYDGDVHGRIPVAASFCCCISSLSRCVFGRSATSYCKTCNHSYCCHNRNKLFQFHNS